jgi:hypothetical protein
MQKKASPQKDWLGTNIGFADFLIATNTGS